MLQHPTVVEPYALRCPRRAARIDDAEVVFRSDFVQSSWQFGRRPSSKCLQGMRLIAAIQIVHTDISSCGKLYGSAVEFSGHDQRPRVCIIEDFLKIRVAHSKVQADIGQTG